MYQFHSRTCKLVAAAREETTDPSRYSNDESVETQSDSSLSYVCSTNTNESDDMALLCGFEDECAEENPPDKMVEKSLPKPSSMEKNMVNAREQRRKHNCIYCDVLVHNFARHLERQHTDELQVQQFLALDKSDPMRKQIIGKIRKEGNFCTGEAVPVQGKENANRDVCSLLPCTHCKGYYSRKTLRRHVTRCVFNKKIDKSKRKRHQSEGHTLMADYFGPRDPLRISGVLQTLKADQISLVAKRDKIICEVGRKYVKSHKEKHLVQVARRYMRRLARLLIKVREIENNNSLTFVSILHPSKFKTIVQATRSVSNYDCDKRSFCSPSLALQMGTLIKKGINAAYSLEIQSDINSPKLNILNIMKKLIEEEWATEVSTEAGQNLHLNRFNKPTVIPVAEDIAKLKNYFDNLISNAKHKLRKDCKDEAAYKMLIEGTYCSLLLFNKRRVGELQRILLDTYMKHQHNNPSGEFEKLLSPTEKILIKKLKRIVVRGKWGRGVPVLFDKVTQEGIDLALQSRHHFFENHNSYLFGLCHSDTSISGYHVFRKHVGLALGDASKVSSLTSTKLRKHLAIISQILKMDNDGLEQLATFMGHTTKTHGEWYRLPSDIYQTAKVSKILLLAQNNCIDQYKGRSLDELDLEGDLMEVQNDSDSEEDREDMQVDEDVNNNEGIREVNKITETTALKKKKKISRTAWSQEEKKVAEEYFRKHINKKMPPKKAEVIKLVESHPELFKNRKWDTIKAYVCNQYNKK